MKKSFLEMFIEDCKYYDSENAELKIILKHVNLKQKTLLDIGAGIGRLAFPLAKYAKKVVALDKDKRFREYFKKHKKRNLEFINKKAEDYLKKTNKFDVILIAWPTINFKFIEIIKKAMHKESLLIFITCNPNSDYETIIDKLKVFNRNYFDKDIKNKLKFLFLLNKRFKALIKKKIKTKYIYPNKKIAFGVLKNSMQLWFNVRLSKKDEKNLRRIINNHNVGKKIKFGEEIWFYIFKLK